MNFIYSSQSRWQCSPYLKVFERSFTKGSLYISKENKITCSGLNFGYFWISAIDLFRLNIIYKVLYFLLTSQAAPILWQRIADVLNVLPSQKVVHTTGKTIKSTYGEMGVFSAFSVILPFGVGGLQITVRLGRLFIYTIHLKLKGKLSKCPCYLIIAKINQFPLFLPLVFKYYTTCHIYATTLKQCKPGRHMATFYRR